jgi:hypothetical protein
MNFYVFVCGCSWPVRYLVMGEVQVWGGNTGQVNWLVPDHLGTLRMIADQTGSLANMKHDYLPFGEEIGLIGGRTGLKGFMNAGTCHFPPDVWESI